MKNILFVSPTGTLDNGAEISIFELQKELKSQGYNIINVTQNSGDKPYIEAFENAGIKNYMLNAVKWWWEDAPGPIQGTERELYHYYREHLNRIQKIVEDEKVDLIVTNSVNMFQGALVAAIKNIPHFWIIHEFPEGEFSYYLDKLDFINEYSTEIFVVQGRLLEKLQKLIPTREIHSFYPFTQISDEKLRAGDKIRLISVGRLTERKNQLELIEAYHRLNNPEVELLLIGNFDKDYKEKVISFIKKNKIKNVTLAGPKDKPWSVVTDKDIFIGPSKMETFGLVYVEALLHGIPSIVSSNPGHQSAHDIFGFGQFYETGNVDQLTNLISDHLRDFDIEKQKSLSVLKELRGIYSVENAYQEVIKFLELDFELNTKSIRHLEKILTTNDNNSESLIARVKHRVKDALIKMRILR
ncbi:MULTISPECIES: glycosyltransferase family 4 protein [Lactococcus]|uniref:Putative glycosyltransferase n=1 Tax=Lactococcus lactis subsp. cremoris TaxID=1359 RepID=A0A161W0U4_LACLC|nr:glycosyltransferase family 4 protein [Lactococcus cremoris]KZK05791.1 putative glycosyltransferase [Lactococcus cremoris]